MEAFNDGATGVLDLPAELIELILTEASYPDICNLRLTCRDLAAKADFLFIELCFRRRHFYLSNPLSMAVLLEISQVPRLARRMQCICFSLDELVDNCFDWALAQRKTSVKGTRDDRAYTRNRRRAYKSMVQDQKTYRKGQCQRDLTQVLRNLMDHGATPRLWATKGAPPVPNPSTWFYKTPAGKAKIQATVGYLSVLRQPEKWNTGPAEALWNAICDTQFPVSHLELGSTTQSISLSRMVSLQSNLILPSKLETLHLTIWSGAREPTAGAFFNLGGLMAILKSAPNLTSLSLALDEKGACKSFHTLLLRGLGKIAEGDELGKALAKLQRLRLDGFQIEPVYLYYFLSQMHRPVLNLDEISLTNIPVWKKEYDEMRETIEKVLMTDNSPDSVKVVVSGEWTRNARRRLGYFENPWSW